MRSHDPAFVAPATVAEAIALLADAGPEARLLAGGTNLLADYRHSTHRPRLIVDITRISTLQSWTRAEGAWTLGPLLTVDRFIEAADLDPEVSCLRDAAALFGGPPIRFRATVGGNIADASPAADLVPPLMALGAEVALEGPGGSRTVPLTTFFTAYRRTALAPDEVIVRIRVPLAGKGTGSAFHKFGNREADAIAVVSAAAWIRLENGHIADARVALGSVAPTVIRAPHVEAALRGRPAEAAAIEEAARQVAADVTPISDIRASAEYRRALAPVLLRRALLDAARRATINLGAGGRGSGFGGEARPGAADAMPLSAIRDPQSGPLAVAFTVNGRAARVDVDPHEILLAALRNRLGLLGAKEGCGQGDCGACTILYDGGPANACLILAAQAAGRRIETVEGLGKRDRLHPLQEAFVRHGAIQCGYCTPGLLMAAKGLLARVPDPTPAQVRMAISGNLCRCTGYVKIVQAILDAAGALGASSLTLESGPAHSSGKPAPILWKGPGQLSV